MCHRTATEKKATQLNKTNKQTNTTAEKNNRDKITIKTTTTTTARTAAATTTTTITINTRVEAAAATTAATMEKLRTIVIGREGKEGKDADHEDIRTTMRKTMRTTRTNEKKKEKQNDEDKDEEEKDDDKKDSDDEEEDDDDEEIDMRRYAHERLMHTCDVISSQSARKSPNALFFSTCSATSFVRFIHFWQRFHEENAQYRFHECFTLIFFVYFFVSFVH